jgi:endoglucanase
MRIWSVVAGIAVVLGAAGCAPLHLGHGQREQRLSGATGRFFADYVDADGRVVRHDQGGDTVSEGQAYAMLLAVAANDRSRFGRVWRWTQDNLQRDDGLLSYHWDGGRVVDENSATDADLDAARALLTAARRFHDAVYRRDAVRIGRAVLAQEVVSRNGRLYLVAGPWARRPPNVVNPSYFAPQTWRELASAMHDGRWTRLVSTARRVVTTFVRSGLPPDWATIGANGGLAASGPPDDAGAAPAYGADAQRLPLRYAETCDPRDARVAASLWPLLRRSSDEGAALAYGLDGRVATGGSHALGALAAAASAAAAGDVRSARALVERAERLNDASPTYYGSAWVALGRMLLTSRALGGCPKLTG